MQITASHNPANYNGFKFCSAGAKPIGADTGLNDIQRMAAMVERGRAPQVGGMEDTRDLWPAYRDHLLEFLPTGVRA